MSAAARALVTGASAGLGAEFARQLASKGKDLILVARRVAPMQKLAAELSDEFNVVVDIIQADLSKTDATAKLFADVSDRGMTVDFLINNAGAVGPDLLTERDWPAQQAYIELMMTSVAGMCHHFIPPMQSRGFGRVLNVASVAGHVSLAGDTSYGPTKAYLIALSKGLAATVGGHSVNVLALCPGFTHTEFHQSPELTRMKSRSPAILWYDAEVVVREGLAALEKGKTVYISGRLYRYLVPVLKTRIGGWLMARMGVKRDY
jgi:short-subunit dehydrogenase